MMTPDEQEKRYKKRLVRDCDNLAREICFKTYGKRCLKPGCKSDNTVIQWCHVFTRSLWHVRWDVRNSVPLHPGCHHYWAHKHPDEFAKLVEKLLGSEEYNKLVIAKNSGTFKRSVSNLENMKAVLEAKLKSGCENSIN